MIWNSVLIQITDMRHGVLKNQQIDEIDESRLFLFVCGKTSQVLIDGTLYPLKNCGMFHVGRNKRIRINTTAGEAEYYLVAYHSELAQNAGREMTRMVMQGSSFDACQAICPLNAAFYLQQFRIMWTAWQSRTQEGQLLIKSGFYAVLHGFYAKENRSIKGNLRPDVADQTRRYLEDHYAESTSMQMLASVLGVSRATLHERFRREFGMSPQQYLMQLRLEKAQKALRDSAATVQEVAASCGLRDKNYFHRIFRQRFGMTPGEYRSQFQSAPTEPLKQKTNLQTDKLHVSPAEKGLLIENFGRIHHYRTTPERLVCLNYSAAEICAALGAADRIVGVAAAEESLSDCIPGCRETLARTVLLPEKSKQNRVPSYQAVCALRPDLVIGTSYAFYERSGVAEASAFEREGIHIYALEATYLLGATFEATYQDIANLGRILNQESSATKIVEEMKAQEAVLREACAELTSPVRVFVFDSEIDGGALTCGQSLESYMICAAGGQNVFGNRQRQFVPVYWQEVADADPEAILVHQFYGSDTNATEKISLIRARPELAKTKAILTDQIYALGIKHVFPGVGNVEISLQLSQWINSVRKK